MLANQKFVMDALDDVPQNFCGAASFCYKLQVINDFNASARKQAMSDNQEDFDRSVVSENVRDPNVWVKFANLILFWFIFYAAVFAAGAISLVQFLSRLFTGEANERLSEFGGNMATFLQQLVKYLTFNSEDRPFPFAPWPDGADEKPKRATRRAAPKVATRKTAANAVPKPEPDPEPVASEAPAEEKDSKEA